MARIDFTGLRSVRLEGDRFVIECTDGNAGYTFSVDRDMATLMALGLQSVSNDLPATEAGHLPVLEVRLVRHSTGTLALECEVSPQLCIRLYIPDTALAGLADDILRALPQR